MGIDWSAAALTEIERTVARLPAELQLIARAVPVLVMDHPELEEHEGLLGCFEGHSLDTDPGNSPGLPSRIILFIAPLVEEAEADPEIFEEEVRITYLHELGHLLGWDEAEVEERGL